MEREEILLLFDIYGSLLTVNMQNCIDLYYNEDFSLAEIAENIGITRQGVRDTILRAVNSLKEYDSVLNLSQRTKQISSMLDEILSLSKSIRELNTNNAQSIEINDAATRIHKLATILKQTENI